VATVGIPVRPGEKITEVRANGKTVWAPGRKGRSSRTLRFAGATPRFLLFEAMPGRWDFVAKKQR
jgi:hypothetical protein